MPNPRAATPHELPHELPPVGVLMVDDRSENLLALEVILDPLGQRLVRAQSGQAALQLARAEQFAVVLMDVRMPGSTGSRPCTCFGGKRVTGTFRSFHQRGRIGGASFPQLRGGGR